jgi:hypothetical protein
MLPSLATLADLEARLGRPITDPAEVSRAEALLADASALVRFEAGRSWVDEFDALIEVPDLAVTITCQAALRGWYNPAGIESQQLGAVSVRYGNAWLTTAERAQLALFSRGKGLDQAILTGSFGFDGGSAGWVPVNNEEGLDTASVADRFPLGWL